MFKRYNQYGHESNGHLTGQSTGRLLALVIVISLASGGLGAGIAAAVVGGSTPVAKPKPSSSLRTNTIPVISATSIDQKVAPSVVDINTKLDPLEGGGGAAGTGMIATGNGEIITNNHVVQGADTVDVTVSGHGKFQAAVVGTDPSGDVAVLQLSGASGLPTIRFGNSANVKVGEPVVAIGNALGLGGPPTVTTGIISASGRTITASDETGSNAETLHGLLQTDAPIAPGNSGGPLVDSSAKVIGMDTAAASAGTVGANLGFAIPSNTVRMIASEIVAHKDVPGLVYGRSPFLGIEVVNSSKTGTGSDPYGSFGNPFGFGFGMGPIQTTPNGTPGVVVAAVDPNSGAAKAGIQSGDVITKADGHPTPTTSALSEIVDSHRPGQVVALTVTTGSNTKTVSVTLAAGPIN